MVAAIRHEARPDRAPGSNFHTGRVSNNVYFATLVETAQVLKGMPERLAVLREQGLDVIED